MKLENAIKKLIKEGFEVSYVGSNFVNAHSKVSDSIIKLLHSDGEVTHIANGYDIIYPSLKNAIEFNRY